MYLSLYVIVICASNLYVVKYKWIRVLFTDNYNKMFQI